ncbi:MAG: response regulator [Nitrospirae bacterium]|nr:response regulator [Nitrospirota bacterium]MBF0533709.1 response regulator [Nitrospirota bacterium]MBF0615582.1 response regulator [Nitrospirota bacterium]
MSSLYKKALLIVVVLLTITTEVIFLYGGAWLSLIMLVLASAVAGLLFRKLIDKPLNILVDYAKKLVDHEYDAKIDLACCHEFEALSCILQFMAIDLTDIFERFEQVAGGLAESDFKIKATLNYLNAVINNMADGLLVADAGGIITRVNKPLAELFGIDASEVTGKSVAEVFGAAMSALLMQSSTHSAEEVISTDIELPSSTVLKASSSVIQTTAETQGQSQAANGVVIMVRDVTRERNVDRMKTDFISTVSHELRTPLTSILGFTEIIQERLQEQVFPALPAGSKKTEKSIKLINDNLNIIIGEGVRLTSLINDVLDIAKMEAGKVDWKYETIRIEDIIGRAWQSTQTLCTKAGLEFIKDIQPDLPPITGDTDRLVQVLINLISNAVKFTKEGSVTCRVKLVNTEMVVSITDTGMGIDAKDKESVFEKFKQVGDTLTDKPKGTGLGLPISKQIVTHHQGRIWVESEPGKGSTFSFTLPVQTETSYRLTSTDLETLMKTIHGGTKAHAYIADGVVAGETASKTILVVDDDESIRELLTQELQNVGYSVETAKNGMEAIKIIKERPPQLIILDVMMPEMNGFDVAAVIKGDPATADVPIIILSVVEDSERGRHLGVDRYLTKPINKELLFSDIKTLLADGASRKKILVVDEDESNVKTLTDVLKTKGYTVVSATDGPDSIEKAKAERPDIIIVDALLSERDQLVKTLRFEKGLENVYFIYLYGPEKQKFPANV